MKVIEKFFTNIEDIFDCIVTDDIEEIHLSGGCLLFADQSTTSSGFALTSKDGVLKGIILCKREQGEEVLEYKLKLKTYLKGLIDYADIRFIQHEQAFDNYVNYRATRSSNSIEDAIKELKYEMTGLEIGEEANTRWKAKLVYPEKVSTLDPKGQIKEHVLKKYPLLANESQDCLDAVGMAIAYFRVQEEKDKDERSRELPIRLIEDKIKVNRRLKIEYELFFVDELDDLLNGTVILKNRNLSNYCKKHGLEFFKYNIRHSFEDNIRTAVSSTDKGIVTIVPEHRGYGQIVLLNRLVHQEGKLLMCVAKRATAK